MLLRQHDEKKSTTLSSCKWHVLDARRSREDLQIEIKAIARKVIAEVENAPLNRLWN